MDHAEAMRRQAGERYLLGELSTEEAEQFEAHYFDCPDCAADLEAGSLLIENARAVFREQKARSNNEVLAPQRPRSETRWSWAALWPKSMAPVTAFAACALACVCIYQGVVLIPQAKHDAEGSNAAVALPSFQLLGNARGEAPVLTVPRNAPFLAVSFDLDPQVSFPLYRCDIKDPAGSVRFSVPAATPAAGQPISILVPARDLKPGKFQLVLSGVPPDAKPVSISDYVFNLDFK